jgi:hypothetical protein
MKMNGRRPRGRPCTRWTHEVEMWRAEDETGGGQMKCKTKTHLETPMQKQTHKYENDIRKNKSVPQRKHNSSPLQRSTG